MLLVTKFHYANYTPVYCPSLAGPSYIKFCTVHLVLWLNCGVLVHVYCPSPGVQYPDDDIMGCVEALFVPPSGTFLVLVECVVEVCVVLVLVYSLSL